MCRKKGGNGPGRFHTIVAENVLLQVTFYEIHAIISSKDQNFVTWFLQFVVCYLLNVEEGINEEDRHKKGVEGVQNFGK